MSYYIDIIDINSPLQKLIIKSASSSGIVLEWSGGDAKDTMAIVGSNLKFDMLTVDDSDMAFIDFFTGDEHRFKTQIKSNADDSIIWQGYILPDLYEEPYQSVNFFVSFTASDGLGRLKGKFLTDEYYSKEKSLIDIYCHILKLTGLDLELYFAPAIENSVQKNWNAIYIDTASFIDGKKKMDAYAIFEMLLTDTLCVCYQCDNRWYIEGINMRQVRKVTYKKYDTVSNYSGTVIYDRLLKRITPLLTPMITMIPPYNEITINHKKIKPLLPKTLIKEVNDGWALVTGVIGVILANDWKANGLYVFCEKPDYDCVVYNKYYFTGSLTATYAQDNTQWVSLKEKLFFSKGQKIKFEFGFKIKKFNIDIPNPDNMDLWKNPFKYEIVFNNEIIYGNFNGTVADQEQVIFSDSGEAKIAIEHIIAEEGLFDFRIYAPTGKVFETKILGIQISSANIDVIDFEEDQKITDLINGDFTIDKEVELTYADDKSGFSKGFRLHKLKEQTSFFNTLELPILYNSPLNNKNYYVVQLKSAKIIKNNPYDVYNNGALVKVLNVFFNFNDLEQMVIETELPCTSGVFTVKIYAIDDVLSSRLNWTQWADSIYKIENTSYSKTVSNIYRRMFNEAHEKLDCTALNAVKFNDIILFRYVYVKDFVVLNCSWNLDDNRTTLTLGRSHYRDANTNTPGDGNIPPIVLAGNDIYITNDQTTASVVAIAFDPDGIIFSQIWTKISGGVGGNIDAPFSLETSFSNLTEDYYTYNIQVKDNDGAMASDLLNIIRIKDYVVSLDLVEEIETSTFSEVSKTLKYKVNVTPQLLFGNILKLTGFFELSELTDASVGDFGGAGYKIEKNGAIIESISNSQGIYTYPLTLGIINTDEIFITLSSSASHGDLGTNGSVSSSINISVATMIVGDGIVTGLPIVKNVSVQLL